MKLEKIEFGGIKGKQLSAQVESMFAEFQNLYKVVFSIIFVTVACLLNAHFSLLFHNIILIIHS